MKITKVVVITAALAAAVALGYALVHSEPSATAISPAGTTGTSGKYYSQTLSLADATGTTTSMYNGSGFDLAARATDVMCQTLGTSRTAYSGAGLAALVFTMSTSSANTVSGNAAQINTNYLANITVSTSTTNSYQSTSTEGVITGTSRIWPNATYLVISSNATNTASCAVGVSVMPL